MKLSFKLIFLILAFLPTFNFESSGLSSKLFAKNIDPVEWASQIFLSTESAETLFVDHHLVQKFGRNGHYYYFVHFAEDARCDATLVQRDRQESVTPCRIKALSHIFVEEPLPIREGNHQNARLSHVPGFNLVYFSSDQSDDHFLLLNEERSSLSMTDSLVAVAMAGRSDPTNVLAIDIEFAFARQSWDEPLTYKEMLRTLEDDEEHLLDGSGIEQYPDFESCEESNVHGDESIASSGWRCNRCTSGGTGSSMCACSASFTTNECVTQCIPGFYACCRCGDFSNRCLCCTSGGGGGGFPGGPGPQPPGGGDDDDPEPPPGDDDQN